MSRRIYAVQELIAGGGTTLVRAGTPAQAIRHVVASRFSVEVASQDVIVDLMGQGATPEDAGEVPAQIDADDKCRQKN